MGWLRFLEAGRKIYCINSPSTAYPIPVCLEEVEVFQRLANDRFCERNHCIVITQMAYDANLLRVPEISWLGVFHSDLQKYHLPDRCLLELTSDDKKKAEAMLLRCYLHKEAPKWRMELEVMLQNGVKFEIESLSVNSLSFLSEYIPMKIQDGSQDVDEFWEYEAANGASWLNILQESACHPKEREQVKQQKPRP
ncbi:meiotic recombination protein [Musa troglodytarum]|uniref:Meiotic recombination protein n=1 Tax=Musa troglodytarum TaxID=320322 RepID=A0A9E7I564_9LILI|nr:meiotic recombination protein [Musa troglodytarum]